MKYWISLVNTTEVDQFVDIAKHAETLGFEGITVPDHLIMPTNIQTPYPYTEDGKVWWPEDNPWADPWVTLMAMGMATSKLKLASNIYLAALRDPFTSARAIGATSIFSQGRVACGVSAGWIKEEYDLLNLDFKQRGQRLDEIIDCLRLLWTGKKVSYQGKCIQFEDVIMSPAPEQQIPIWVGGASKAALRRAARNDGWLGIPMLNEQLKSTVDQLREYRQQQGMYGQPFDLFLTPMEAITPEFINTLDPYADFHSSALPWTPSPWGRAMWVEEGEDHQLLSVKKKAMERFKTMMEQMGLWS